MPSPFPGMDPFIEAANIWGDFHGGMVVALRNELNQRLPEGYAAELDLYVWLLETNGADRHRLVEPDVYVKEEGRRLPRRRRASASTSTATLTFPTVVRHKQRRVQVVDLQTRRIVTVLELLSPTNKAHGPDREKYLAKRNDYFASRVNLIELDLLRKGPRLPLGEPPPEVKDFYVLVCREWQHPRADFWTFGLSEPMPTIPVPLQRNEAEVELPLRAAMDNAYDGGRYRRRLPYAKPLSPRPAKSEATWLRAFLAKQPAEE